MEVKVDEDYSYFVQIKSIGKQVDDDAISIRKF